MKTKESGKILLCCCVFSFSFRRWCYTVLYRCVWLQHIAQSLASKCVSPPLSFSLFGWFNFTMYCHGYRKKPSLLSEPVLRNKKSERSVIGISREVLFVFNQKPHDKKRKKERKPLNELDIVDVFGLFASFFSLGFGWSRLIFETAIKPKHFT